MPESIKCRQIRVLRACIFNDWVFVTNNTGYLSEPIAGKRIADVKFSKCKSPDISVSYKATTKGKCFILYNIHFGHTSQTMYVITMDDRIIYYTFSSTFASASSAWKTLTELYFFGYNKKMSWVWCSLYPSECYNYLNLGTHKKEYRIEFKKVKNVDKFVANLYYHY